MRTTCLHTLFFKVFCTELQSRFFFPEVLAWWQLLAVAVREGGWGWRRRQQQQQQQQQQLEPRPSIGNRSTYSIAHSLTHSLLFPRSQNEKWGKGKGKGDPTNIASLHSEWRDVLTPEQALMRRGREPPGATHHWRRSSGAQRWSG